MARDKLILAGDIGGTKTHLALFSANRDKLAIERQATFASKDYAGLQMVLAEFLGTGSHTIGGACFGIAGPIIEGRVKTPNLPWVVSARELADAIKLPSVSLLNDLEAAAYGIFTLEDEEFLCLNEAQPRRPGNKGLIAAGTGLGEAILYDDGRDYHPIASEGGHGDFAPRDALEIELLRYLIERFGHVSYERVISGPGIFSIYSFLRERGGFAAPADFERELEISDDRSALISKAGLAGKPEICAKAMDMFVAAYGAEAGNLALRAKAIGGIYIAGGIAPKIKDKLLDGTFMRAFVDKGRYRDFAGAISVYVVLNDKAALRGAACYALRFGDC